MPHSKPKYTVYKHYATSRVWYIIWHRECGRTQWQKYIKKKINKMTPYVYHQFVSFSQGIKLTTSYHIMLKLFFICLLPHNVKRTGVILTMLYSYYFDAYLLFIKYILCRSHKILSREGLRACLVIICGHLAS